MEANHLKYGDDLFNVTVQLFSNDGAIIEEKKNEVKKLRASSIFSSLFSIMQYQQHKRYKNWAYRFGGFHEKSQRATNVLQDGAHHQQWNSSSCNLSYVSIES